MASRIVRHEGSDLTTVRAAIYARVSTLNGHQDPSMQTRELEEYCRRRAWLVFDCYVDNGFSGKKDSRPQLNRMMQDAHERKFECRRCLAIRSIRQIRLPPPPGPRNVQCPRNSVRVALGTGGYEYAYWKDGLYGPGCSGRAGTQSDCGKSPSWITSRSSKG
jgi:Resolvase, N terminal domain